MRDPFNKIMIIGTVLIVLAVFEGCAPPQPSVPEPKPDAAPVVTMKPDEIRAQVHEFCYEGARYIYVDRGIAPKYVMANDGLVVQQCEVK